METRAYAAFQSSSEIFDREKIDISDKDSVDSGGSSITSKDDTPSPSQKKKLTFRGMLRYMATFARETTIVFFLFSHFSLKRKEFSSCGACVFIIMSRPNF